MMMMMPPPPPPPPPAHMTTTTSTSALGMMINDGRNSLTSSLAAKMRSNVNVINVTMEKPTNVILPNRVFGMGVVSSMSNSNNISGGGIGGGQQTGDGSTITAGNMTGGSMNDQMATNVTGGGSLTNTPSPKHSNRINYVRRGPYYGALFDANHLATFAAGKNGNISKTI